MAAGAGSRPAALISGVVMHCAYCGARNESPQDRCGHCGRRLEEPSKDLWSRAGLSRDSPEVLPALRGKPSAEMPQPIPEWKKQLHQKLDAYRERQKEQKPAPSHALRSSGAMANPSPERPLKLLPFQTPGLEPGASLPAKRGGPVAIAEPADGEAVASTGAGLRGTQEPPASSKLPQLRRKAAGDGAKTAPPPAGLADYSLASDDDEGEVAGPSTAAIEIHAAPIATRAAAGLLDLALVVVALGVFSGALMAMTDLTLSGPEGQRTLALSFFGILVFYWIFYLRYIGETAGMMWAGLHLVTFDARAPDEGQRWARALGMVLSCAALGLGFAWSLGDEEKLTWHDRMSKTYVSSVPPLSRAAVGSPSRRGQRREFRGAARQA